MDKRVYLYMMIAFIVGMVELIIGGILDLVAVDLGISLSKTGLLITMFSLTFAIAAPILLVLTAKVERKKLMLTALIVFLGGNILAIISKSFTLLMLSRIVSAMSGSLLTILCITIASSIVRKEFVGRAIGLVVMGISGSLVLGVPIGLLIGENFGWRATFIFIAILTTSLIIINYFTMEKIKPAPAVPLKEQLATLKNSKILFAHFTMFLFLAGSTTLYAYFTPFLKMTMGLTPTMVSVIYFTYGVAAISGGGIGGTLTDRYGYRPVMLTVITLFAVTMLAIPYTIFVLPIFIIAIIIWGMLSWAITPSIQSYLITTAPETAAVHQSLSNSALHFGIAFGSFIGGIVINQTDVVHNATIGGFIVFLGLGAAIFSLSRKGLHQLTAAKEVK